MSQPSPSLSSQLRGAVDLSALKHRASAPATPAPGAPGAAAAPGNGAAAPAGPVIPLPTLSFDATDATFGDVLELSRSVPIIVDLWAEWCQPCKQLTPVLERVVADYAGRVLLVKIDVDSNPQLSQAFQATSIPTVVALLQGQSVPLFQGAVPEEQVRQVFEQVLQLAAANGVTGTVRVEGADAAADAPAAPALPPRHAAAFAAIEAGDFALAISEYEAALKENPRDEDARAGLGQVRLLDRVQGLDLQAARAAAAAAPTDPQAQFAVADLDLSGGHVDDAFDRLLELFAASGDDVRPAVKERLLELFGVVGDADPRTLRARRAFANLLF
ncbi:MAG: tetratricopeptide repeat protein [Microbacteriaceae bacterium]|nr:tetratricopeptide repeat protein [Microbacteriaceae bacterium]HPZ34921.1 tetratricopeptide repeat protein [Microbacteriaceae bacterium]HQC93819.1 tetratricopeptide repeat protein [Microbacteriaceae bacterium]